MPVRIPDLAPTPPLGWNSFDCFGGVANERVLLENLEVFAEKLKPAGYEYFVLDIGWYGEYQIDPGCEFPQRTHAVQTRIDEHGRYLPSKVSFPNGLKGIIDRAHELGVKFGIHIMRGVPRAAVEQDTPILGTTYRASQIANVHDICNWCPYNYGIDMTKPGAQAYYDSFIALLAEWGVDFIKADNLVPHPAEIHAIADAIEKCGRPMVYSLSPGGSLCVSHLDAYRRSNMLRTTKDIWDEPQAIADSFLAWRLWQGTERTGYWPDLDMIPFGELTVWREQQSQDRPQENLLYGKGVRRLSKFSSAQKRTFIAQRALAASPLMMGGHLPGTDDESFKLITHPDILACNQNGVCGEREYARYGHQVWRTPRKDAKNAGWLGVFNGGSDTLAVELPRGSFGQGDATIECRNCWTGDTFRVTSDITKLEVPGDDVVLIAYSA